MEPKTLTNNETTLKKMYNEIIDRIRKDLPVNPQSTMLITNSPLLTLFSNLAYLGSGSFSKVYLATKQLYCQPDQFDHMAIGRNSITLQKTFVLKIISKFDYTNVITEVETLSALIHPNIVSCYNIWEESKEKFRTDWKTLKSVLATASTTYGDDSVSALSLSSSDESSSSNVIQEDRYRRRRFLCLQFEHCDGGTLDDILRERITSKRNNLAENASLILQILEGLVYLQAQHIVHGDLKPSNIFVVKSGDGGNYLVKLGDFGLSILRDSEDEETPQFHNKGRYHSFEVVESRHNRTHKSDMFAFGLITMQILTSHLYKNEKDLLVKVYEASKEGQFPDFVKSLREFGWLKACLSRDTKDRPSAKECKDLLTRDDVWKTFKAYGLFDEFQALAACAIGLHLVNIIKDNKGGYRYLCAFFYSYLPHILTVDMDDPYESAQLHHNLAAVIILNKLSLQFGRLADQFYRLSLLIPILSIKLGDNHLLTMDFKMQLLNLYWTNKRSSNSNKWVLTDDPRFSEKLEGSITKRKNFRALPVTDRLRSDMMMLFVHKMMLVPESEDTIFEPGMELSLNICLGLYYDYEKLLKVIDDNSDDGWETCSDGDEEKTKLVKIELPSRIPSRATILDRMADCTLNTAKIYHKLGIINKSRENFKHLLNFELFTLTPIILTEYAIFVIDLEEPRKLYVALIYIMAAYQLFEEEHGQSANNYDLASCIVMLLELLGMKEDQHNFINRIVAKSERENRLFITTEQTGNQEDAFKLNLLSNAKITQGFNRHVKNDGFPADAVAAGARTHFGELLIIPSVKDLLDNLPPDVLAEGGKILEFIKLATILYGRYANV